MDSVQYSRPRPFIQELRRRVNAHLEEAGIPRHGGLRIIGKSLVILALFVASYIYLVFFAQTWWQVVLSGIMVAQSIVLIGFCIMHDASHGAFSGSRRVNRILAWSLDFIGGSQALWKIKHVSLHHGYPNILNHDRDIESGGRLRMHAGQPWKPFHRYQVWYALPLYSLLALHWIVSEIGVFFREHVVGKPEQRAGIGEIIAYILLKLIWVGFALVVPFLFNPWLGTALTFLGVMLMTGFTLSLVFQLAHVSAGLDMPSPTPENPVTGDWAEHQLRTTTDFAPRNPFLGWYLGGLNAQVVHHLFPRVSHVRYRRLQPIVAQTCQEMGLPYHCHGTLWSAIRAHLRQLRALSRKPAAIEAMPGLANSA